MAEKYVPPAIRPAAGDDLCKIKERLKRHLKGLVNKVSESNIHVICNELEALYRVNSRAVVTQVLSDIILAQFDSVDPLPERLITESAMLIAVLCHNIGPEVMAYFLENAVKKLNDLMKVENYGNGKECNNIVQLVCSLYELKVIQKQIVLDIIDAFVGGFTERDIELLVVLLRKIGFQLRKDDAISLKNILENISLKSSKLGPDETSRMKHMLEVLTAIKNNNVRKILCYDVELINKRRKIIKLNSKNASDVFPNVTFQDLVDADLKGRWWIVGSSWRGTPMLKDEICVEGKEVEVNATIVKAAKRLRMNTDIRKKVFYAIMSAEDFVEAFENVMTIGLKGKQLREVSHVVVECCQKEKTFNPFYFHLLNKFCRHDRQFVMTVQCSFWDRFKLLTSLPNRQTSNLAKLLSKLIISEGVPLSILKTIDYIDINKATISFLKNVLSNIASESSDVKQIETVFGKLGSNKYTFIRKGLKLFIQKFMMEDDNFMNENLLIKDVFMKMDTILGAGNTVLF